MFSQIAHDNKNNVYCWYDYQGVPSRWVEISGRHAHKYEGYEEAVLKKCAQHGLFEAFPEINEQAKDGFVKGYYLYNIHPIGMGGNLYGKGFSNLSLVPHDIIDKVYRFLNGWYYGSLLLKKKQVAADGHKIFVNVPILPTVVSEKDVEFISVLNDPISAKKHDELCIRGHDILMQMRINQLLASGMTQETYAHTDYKLAQCIYPPKSLRDKIAHTTTIAGGPTKPELVTTKLRELIVPNRLRQRD